MMRKINYTNPLHYKYYWWVVLKSDLPEDYPILSESLMLKKYHLAVEGWFKKYSIKRKSERMCTYDAMAYMEELENNNQPYVVYDKQLPRKGPGSPFDPIKAKWKDCEEWAPAFEDDTGPVWNGHK